MGARNDNFDEDHIYPSMRLLIGRLLRDLIVEVVGIFNGYELRFILRGWLFNGALKGSFVYDY